MYLHFNGQRSGSETSNSRVCAVCITELSQTPVFNSSQLVAFPKLLQLSYTRLATTTRGCDAPHHFPAPTLHAMLLMQLDLTHLPVEANFPHLPSSHHRGRKGLVVTAHQGNRRKNRDGGRFHPSIIMPSQRGPRRGLLLPFLKAYNSAHRWISRLPHLLFIFKQLVPFLWPHFDVIWCN